MFEKSMLKLGHELNDHFPQQENQVIAKMKKKKNNHIM